MPDSCREQIVKDRRAALEAVGTDVKVERNRRVPLDLDALRSEGYALWLGLFEGDESPREDFTFEDAYDLQLLVQCVALKQEGDSDDAELASHCNDLRARAQRAFLADLTCGGLARDVRAGEAGDFFGVDAESESVNSETFNLAYQVTYATKQGDPFTFADAG